MSKAFTSEETPDEPIVVPARAPLPPGVPNYVTVRGLALLRAELAELEAARAALGTAREDDAEQARRRLVLGARIAALATRVGSAQLVDPHRQSRAEVRFGATIELRVDGAPEVRRYTIVGVDEADPAAGRIAFLAPLARALLGLGVGDTATFETGAGEQTLEVVAITYE